MTRMMRVAVWVALACGWAGAGCRHHSAPAPGAEVSTGEAQRQVFQVKGVVKEVLAPEKKVRVAHEEIPNYMEAMTMLFEVKAAGELEGLTAGDEIAFDMVVTKDDGWIEKIRKVGRVSVVPGQADTPSRFRLVREVEPLEEGDDMPNYHFTNELGRAVSLHDHKGQAVALTFIFTRCPFPTFCPRMSMRMAEVARQLQSNRESPTNWHLFSITIDPEFDTPSVLRAYARGYGYQPERWNFLTAPLIDITAIAEQFGLDFFRPDLNQPGNITHNLRTVVITPHGKVQKILLGNEWTAEELLKEMRIAMGAGSA